MNIMSKLSKIFRITAAVIIAVFSINLAPAMASAAGQSGTDQPVWCHHTGNHWSVQIGDDNSGDRNDNYPLYMTNALRALVDSEGEEILDGSIANDSQAYTHDRHAKIDASFCEAQFTITTPSPSITPVCGLNNDGVSVTKSQGYTWHFTGWNTSSPAVVFTAVNPYTFANGQTTATVPVTELNTNTDCDQAPPTEITVPAGYTAVCGIKNDILPTLSDGSHFTIKTDSGWMPIDGTKYDRTVTYQAVDEYVFSPSQGWTLSTDSTEATYTYTDWGDACPVTPVIPATPAATNLCFSDLDSISIPSTEHVIYKVDNNVVSGSLPFDGSTITVTAEAANDYTLGDNQASWTFTQEDFPANNCLTITKKFASYEDSNKDGIVSPGDALTWTIALTNTSSIDLPETFTVEIEDLGVTLTVEDIAAGQTVVEEVTTTLSDNDMRACEATNTASFSAQRTNVAVERLDTDTLLATGTASDSYAFTCPTPGKGNQETPTVTTVTPLAPDTGAATELPETGIRTLNPLIAIIAAVLAYGAIYFAQPRRKFER